EWNGPRRPVELACRRRRQSGTDWLPRSAFRFLGNRNALRLPIGAYPGRRTGGRFAEICARRATAGGIAMPLLLLGLVIGAALAFFYMTRSGGGATIFKGGETFILIDDGTLRLRKGWVSPRVLSALTDVLREAGVSQGHITLSPDRRVAVSWH